MWVPQVKVTKHSFHRAFIHNGVDCELTNSSRVNVLLEPKTYKMTLEEVDLRCPSNPRLQVTFSLQKAISDSMIGSPLCIGARGSLYILQYKTNESRFLKFLLVDSVVNTVQCFDDSVEYLEAAFAIQSPLECLISPDCCKVFFRVPFGLRTRTKILCADIVRLSDGTPCVTDIYDGGLLDSKYHEVVFDWRYDSRAVFFTVDKPVTTVKIRTQDFSEGSKGDTDKLSSVGVDRNWDLVNWSLGQCRVAICRSGEIAALCCVSSVRNGRQQLKLCMFDMDNFSLIYNHSDDIHLSDCEEQIFLWPSVCDTKLLLYAGYKFSIDRSDPIRYRQLVREFSLPKQLNLQGLCRAVILQNCSKEHLDELGLPKRLKLYLHFQS